jgi:hypothetical protein
VLKNKSAVFIKKIGSASSRTDGDTHINELAALDVAIGLKKYCFFLF